MTLPKNPFDHGIMAALCAFPGVWRVDKTTWPVWWPSSGGP